MLKTIRYSTIPENRNSETRIRSETVFSAFMGFRYFVIQLLITCQVLFLLFVILATYGRVCFVCSHFLSWLSVLSCHFHCSIYFHLYHMIMSILNLNEFFRNFFQYQRWTIVEPSLGRYGCHGIGMAIDGAPRNVMTIGELHRSFSTVTFKARFQAPSVSPQLRGNIASEASQPFVEKIFD